MGGFTGMPGPPPWHMWGNTQRLRTTVQDSAATANDRITTGGQLARVSYGRPETWRWLFQARLISGPNSPVNATSLEVSFQLVAGIGRSNIRLVTAGIAAQDQSFERYDFQWGPLGPFPAGVHLYSTQCLAPNRLYRTDPPFPDQTGNAAAGSESASVIETITAQDIQLNVRLVALAPPGTVTIGQQVEVEVSGHFAPNAHVRPDWFQDGPRARQFPGGETGAR